MFRSILRELRNLSGAAVSLEGRSLAVRTSVPVRYSHVETDVDYVKRYKNYFDKHDIDHWEIRQGMNRLAQDDGVPDPEIIIAALKATRRLNDYAMAVRFLETVLMKCGPKKKSIWPYILIQVGPTMAALGIDDPEDLGYDEPELWCKGTDNVLD